MAMIALVRAVLCTRRVWSFQVLAGAGERVNRITRDEQARRERHEDEHGMYLPWVRQKRPPLGRFSQHHRVDTMKRPGVATQLIVWSVDAYGNDDAAFRDAKCMRTVAGPELAAACAIRAGARE